jgi:hypothetical protein
MNSIPAAQRGANEGEIARIRNDFADVLAARMAGTALAPHVRHLAGHRVTDMIANLARRRGATIGDGDHVGAIDLALNRSASHTTSDFPLLLQDAANKVLLPQYRAAAVSYRAIATRRTFNDFRDHRFLRAGDFPGLQEITEGGEVKFGAISEAGEIVRLKEYGAGISISRRALINDDLGAFRDFAAMAGARAAHDENALVWAVLAGNGPVLRDGKSLFHVDHGNTAAVALDVTGVAEAVKAMGDQTSLDGMHLNLSPKFLAVGTGGELAARQLLATIQPGQVANVNPYSGRFELIVDANIAGTRWHMIADPAMAPALVYGWLGSADGPQIRTEIDFNTRALKVAVGDDFACGALDHRGIWLGAPG